MNGDDAYLETKVMTATPHQLHLIVVDAAIRYAMQAEKALAEDDFETAHFALNHSRNFVAEMISGLDAQKAPELVEKLRGLFVFVYRNLVDADLRHDVVTIRDALQILRMHRDTWNQLSEKLRDENTETHGVPQPKLSQDQRARSWTS